MKTFIGILLLLLYFGTEATASAAPAKPSSSFAKRLVGQWMIDARPPRFINYQANGTWKLMYAGDANVQTGRWSVEGDTLRRDYVGGAVRFSQIVSLGRSALTLRTNGQEDHYRRMVATRTITGPVRVIR